MIEYNLHCVVYKGTKNDRKTDITDDEWNNLYYTRPKNWSDSRLKLSKKDLIENKESIIMKPVFINYPDEKIGYVEKVIIIDDELECYIKIKIPKQYIKEILSNKPNLMYTIYHDKPTKIDFNGINIIINRKSLYHVSLYHVSLL